MLIYRSIRTNLISQKFGQNKLPIYKKSGMLGHSGLDFVTKHGEPIYWSSYDCEGEVLNHYIDSAGGIGIDVIAKDKDKIYKLRFWHLIKGGYMPKVGTILSTGDLVGYADNTGKSTGNHLHFGLKPQIIDSNGNYKNEFYSNGYWGAIDPLPFYKNIYIRDYMYILNEQLNIIERLIYLFKLKIKERFDILRIIMKK